MKFSKYIVPIITDVLGEKDSGTGFLYKDYLITADHVVKNKTKSYFRFENNWYKIKTNSFIVLPDRKNEDWLFPNESQDLFVCKTDFCDSDLILSDVFCKNSPFEYLGFFYDEISENFVETVASDMILSHEIAYNSKGGKLSNCFSCKGNLKPGNSGGPLFWNNSIIGMLIQSINYCGGRTEYVFIKTDYILKEIEKGLIIFNEINNPK